MKKLLFLAALGTGLHTTASAQTQALKVNILSPLVRTGSFFYEHQVGKQQSVQLGGLFTAWSAGNTSIRGFALTPEYRYYVSGSKPALAGFYLAPFVRYQQLTLTATDDYSSDEAKASLTTFGGGVLAGYQLVLKQRFTLDAFLGPSYNGGSLKTTMGNASETFNAGPFEGFGVRSGITFGVAF